MGRQDKPIQEKLCGAYAETYEISSQMDQPLSGTKGRLLSLVC